MVDKLYFKCKFDGSNLIRITKTDELELLSPMELEISNKINKYISGEIRILDIKYKLNGTDFQMKVWKALEQIPAGENRTYKEIALEVGNEKASRAVGMACNKNPLPIIVPCHRVIGTNGKLTGFIYGLDIKQKLLINEGI